ncbi:MAG: hypothetical protein EOP49_49840, partial [Sphingobacteriales bacterium]
QSPAESCILAGWLGGPGARALKNAGDSILHRLAIESLANIFSKPASFITSALVAYKIVDWNITPYVNGAYSYAGVRTKEARRLLQTPVENTLYFAGEAISSGKAPGAVEAALESAWNVVQAMDTVYG